MFFCLFLLPLAIALGYSVLKHWNNRLLSSLNSFSKNVPSSVWSGTSDVSSCSSCFAFFQMISLAAAFLRLGSGFQLCFTSDHSTVGSVTAGRLNRLSMSEHLTGLGEILSEIWLVSFFLSPADQYLFSISLYNICLGSFSSSCCFPWWSEAVNHKSRNFVL